MRKIVYLLSILVVLGVGYEYVRYRHSCDVPFAYRLGTIDERFGLSVDTARLALRDAEALWEDSTGKDLFVYDENASFTVNFIYDERQELTDREQDLRYALDIQNDLNESIREEHEAKSEVYEELKQTYEKRQEAYSYDIEAYNRAVSEWNDKGGAPEDVYEELNREQSRLESEWGELSTIIGELNTLVDELNALGEQGDSLVNRYNNVVEDYNGSFDTEREFTQGDYQGKYINIYEYENSSELRIVLAHELGHALSLDHVEGESSIMYHLMNAQAFEDGLTEEDVAAVEARCAKRSIFSW